MLIQIVRHTPLWVWGLLAALLALGLAQTRPRRVSRGRLLALPASLLLLGAWTMAAAFVAQPAVLAGWLLALAGFAWLGQQLPLPRGARWDTAAARLALPGSWLPLALITVIFMLRYALGATLALHPDWRAALQLQLPAAAAFGALSGLLLGRALGLRRLAAAAPHNPAR